MVTLKRDIDTKYGYVNCEICGDIFYAPLKTKYCSKHAKQIKLQQSKDWKSENRKIKNPDQNISINHSYTEAVHQKMKCECCGVEFEITVLPRTYVYPKYCEEHRNEFKRKMYNSKNS
jgi:hypothetical protein